MKTTAEFCEMNRDWTWLSRDMLHEILTKLVSLSDYLRFGVVCKSWHSVALEQKQHRINTCNQQLPLLMVPTQDNNSEWRGFFNAIEKKFLDFKIFIPYNRRCCGSSHGWLSFVEKDWSVILFNPYTRATIHLPQIKKPEAENVDTESETHLRYYPYKVYKLILSTDASLSPDNYVVVAIYLDRHSLAFIRSGSESWTYVDWKRIPCTDIIFYKGLLYAAGDRNCDVVSVDISNAKSSSSPPELNILLSEKMENPVGTCRENYLVESTWGELLFVSRILGEVTIDFRIFRVVDDCPSDKPRSMKLVEIKSIGHDAFFLGDNHSFAISALEYIGCQPNSIYFTDDYTDDVLYPSQFGHPDIGVFNLKDRSITKHYKPDVAHENMPPPIWIMPRSK